MSATSVDVPAADVWSLSQLGAKVANSVRFGNIERERDLRGEMVVARCDRVLAGADLSKSQAARIRVLLDGVTR